jgi:hypothetical protein
MEEQTFKEIILENIDEMENQYNKGISVVDVLYQFGITKRLSSMQFKINELFRLINLENLLEAKTLYQELEKVLGENDGDLHQAKTEIDLSEHFDFKDEDFE